MSVVTDNVSTPPGVVVTCYGCEDNANEATSKAESYLGNLHCTDCHKDGHRACAMCGTCMARPILHKGRQYGYRGHRWDRFYCSSTCRVKAKRERERQALERAAWEAEHPEEAAAQRREWEAIGQILRAGNAIDAMDGKDPAQRAWEDQVRLRAERCAHVDFRDTGRPKELSAAVAQHYAEFELDLPTVTERVQCDVRFGPGDVIYRRHGREDGSKVLPYCERHACPSYSGHHNRDAPDGRYFPYCSCPGDERGDRNWLPAEPCAFCGRSVRIHRAADPRRFTRNWMDAKDAARLREFRQSIADLSEDERREAWASFDGRVGNRIRTFCSDSCRRAVFCTEAKAKRLAARSDLERRCSVCHRRFTPRRADAQTCSSACRQKAYRNRKSADA
jgi:hypothetical protein